MIEQLALTVQVVAMGLATYRVLRGPTLPDRVVGLDILTAICVGAACTYAMSTNEPLLLYPAAVLGLLAFLGTITIAMFLERGVRR